MGYGFGTSTSTPIVSFSASLPATCSAVSHPLFGGTQFTCTMNPSGAPQDSGYLLATVEVNSVPSAEAIVLLVDPVITASLAPASAGGLTVIQINGFGFGTVQPTVTLGLAGAACTAVAPYTSTIINCEVDAAGISHSGPLTATVTTGGTFVSASSNIALIHPTVTISHTRLAFTDLEVNDELTITGSGFLQATGQALVLLDLGAACSTTWTSLAGNELHCTLLAAPLSAGIMKASVIASGQLSGASIPVADVYPVIASTPQAVYATPSAVFTIAGSGFGTTVPSVAFDTASVACSASAPSGGTQFACTFSTLPSKASLLTGTSALYSSSSFADDISYRNCYCQRCCFGDQLFDRSSPIFSRRQPNRLCLAWFHLYHSRIFFGSF